MTDTGQNIQERVSQMMRELPGEIFRPEPPQAYTELTAKTNVDVPSTTELVANDVPPPSVEQTVLRLEALADRMDKVVGRLSAHREHLANLTDWLNVHTTV
jgi:hypothetical protein